MKNAFFIIVFAFPAFSQARNPLIDLGNPSAATLKYSAETVIDDACEYTITAKFQHPSHFPVGDALTCAPDVMASDGAAYFANRWYYERLPYNVKLATGFDHLSIDYNACGHPGFGFQINHYDMHMYTVSPEFRATQMECVKNYGTPVCSQESMQQGSGLGYYVFGREVTTNKLDNLPPGYDWELDAAIEYMGTHGGNSLVAPADPSVWKDPILYFTSFGGSIASFEPMFPPTWTHASNEYKYKEYDVNYELKTSPNLPVWWAVEYNNVTEFTTVTVKGESALCKEEFANTTDPNAVHAVTTDTSAGFSVRETQSLGMLALLGFVLLW